MMVMEGEERVDPNAHLKNSVFDLKSPVRRDLTARPDFMRKTPKHLSIVEARLANSRLNVAYDGYLDRVSGLVIGENPGPNTHWATPLFPDPDTSSAGRLLKMSGMTPGEYLGGLYRRNLVDEKTWSLEAARARARELLTALFDQSRQLRVVLLGAKVAKAFNLQTEDFWAPVKLDSRQLCVVVPHPSGMNRMYNDPANQRATRRWIRWAALGEDRS